MPVHYDDPKNSKYVENAKQTFSFTYLTSEELYNLIRTEGMVIGAQPPNKYSLMIRDDILGFKGKPLLSQDDLRLNRELDRELEPDFTTTTTVTYLPSASVVKAEPQKQKEKEGNTEKAFATDDSSIAEHKSKKQKFRKA